MSAHPNVAVAVLQESADVIEHQAIVSRVMSEPSFLELISSAARANPKPAVVVLIKRSDGMRCDAQLSRAIGDRLTRHAIETGVAGLRSRLPANPEVARPIFEQALNLSREIARKTEGGQLVISYANESVERARPNASVGSLTDRPDVSIRQTIIPGVSSNMTRLNAQQAAQGGANPKIMFAILPEASQAIFFERVGKRELE